MGIRQRLKLKHAAQDSDEIKFSRSDVKVRKLGEGVSGIVELFQCRKSRHQYVVKTYHCKEVYETKKEYRERVLQEYYILSSIDHVNFISIYKQETSFDGLKVRIYLQAGSNDLYQLIKAKKAEQVDSGELLCFWKQLCNGINYLHNTANMCHRDLKLNNLVIDLELGYLKIIDLATAVGCESASIGIVGSILYLSPESMEAIYYDGKKSDVWSIGIILYFMINRRFPWKSARLDDDKFVAFKNSNYSSTGDSKESVTAPPPIIENEPETGVKTVLSLLPVDSILLVSRIFQIDPIKRCSIEDFYTYNWFKEISCCDEDAQCSIKHTYLQ